MGDKVKAKAKEGVGFKAKIKTVKNFGLMPRPRARSNIRELYLTVEWFNDIKTVEYKK